MYLYVFMVFTLLTTPYSCRIFLPFREVRRIVQRIDPCCVYSRVETESLYDIEHIVPRKVCEELFHGHYPQYENDMHTLFKCTPSLNRKRGYKKFGNVDSKDTFGIDDTKARAIVSRACMYFRDNLSIYQRDMFHERVIGKDTLEEWYDKYGVHVNETDITRERIVRMYQKTKNKYVF